MSFEDFHGEGPPEWRPLEAIVPLEQCADFMYMGWFPVDGRKLHHYKHIDTRRYLFLTDALDPYRYLGEFSYVPQPMKGALRHVFAELEWMRPQDYGAGAVRRLVERCARRRQKAKGMLAYHETDLGEASR